MQELPDYNFETLKLLVNHLKLVSDNCDKNKVMWVVLYFYNYIPLVWAAKLLRVPLFFFCAELVETWAVMRLFG